MHFMPFPKESKLILLIFLLEFHQLDRHQLHNDITFRDKEHRKQGKHELCFNIENQSIKLLLLLQLNLRTHLHLLQLSGCLLNLLLIQNRL
jgi:hypothetical protein